MQLPITGPDYEHPSLDANRQRSINFFPVPAGPSGVANPRLILMPTAGLAEMVDLTGSETRAIINFDDTIYAIVDDTVYKLTINDDAETATGASVGKIGTNTGLIKWARNPTQIFITDGTTAGGWILTPADDTLTQITDADFTGAATVVFMDSYFLYNTPGSITMYATAINDGTSVSALDVVSAEGNPDGLVGLAVDKRELWAFGERSVEIWYDSANATGFPFSRREGAWIDIGCGAKDTILNVDNTLCWLDHRGYVVLAEGYNPRVISTPAMHADIKGYSSISDAYAMSYMDHGHLMYAITFPVAKKTWVFDFVTKQWHQRAYFNQNDEFEQHRIQASTEYKNIYLTASRNSGQVLVVKDDTYLDGGDPLHRLRVTAHQQLELSQVGVASLELHLQSGNALETGTGSDPQIMMRYSHDGGYTWSSELIRSIGKIGEYGTRVRWNSLGTGRDWIFEFRITDPISVSIIDAYVEMEPPFHA